MLNKAQTRWLSGIRAALTTFSGILIALTVSIGGAAGTDYSAPAAAHHTIEITNFKFKPNRLEVSVGDTVTWINNDIVPHNIALNNGKELLSPILNKGEEFTFKPEVPMTYICGLHPGMQGAIMAAKSRASTRATTNQTFQQ